MKQKSRQSRGNASKGSSQNDNKSQRNERSDKGSKGKSRNIKNARSLADVIGGAKSRGGPSGFGPKRDGRPAGPDRDQARGESKGPTSKKLQYIMTFQPPPEAGRPDVKPPPRPEPRSVPRGEPVREARTSRSEPPSRAPKTESRGAKSNDASRAPKTYDMRNGKPVLQTPKAETPGAEKSPTRGTEKSARASTPERTVPSRQQDARWPANRVKPAEAEAPPEQANRGTGRSKPGAKRLTGFVKRHPDGFGFFIPDESGIPDVYISRQSMTGVMTNDKVVVDLYQPRSFQRGKEDRLSGDIVSITARANTRVVGKYLPVDQRYGVLLDENRGWGADLRIAAKDAMDAKEGEMVSVEITQYPDDDHEFTGRVVARLGDLDEPVNDVIRIVHTSGIPLEFSKEAIADAAKFGGKVTDQERRGREDLTSMSLITIDGATARDFDDAVHTEKTETGFRLTVAIADVSHYVKPGSRLDEEAYDRGTSTYFPNFVVPMLPEELSNELCSLKPHVIRLCFCCEMEINHQGDIEAYRFFEGVMESKARVIYGEAQEVIDAIAKNETRGNKTVEKLKHVADNILRSADLARILMAKRFREGSLDLEIPETQVVVDATGESVDIIRSERLFAHRLIEELMLVTNICTARYLDQHKIAGIYRIHEEPEQDSIKSLQRYLWNLGGTRAVTGTGTARKLTQALEAMKDRPEAQILNILTLRTMQQARYSEENVGHFGLGFTHYSHFTSPIRRYPDLIAHRLIKSELNPKYQSMRMTEDEIASATTWLSACEQRSVKAERKVISIKKARFMRQFEGQEFEGIISSVAKFGIFVLLRKYDVDGMVKIENLGPDRFQFDEENLRLTGTRTGLKYVIGDLLKVRVAKSDPETGKIDLELAELPAPREDAEDDERGAKREGEPRRGQGKSGKKKFDAKKRGKNANDRSGVRKERVSKRRGKN